MKKILLLLALPLLAQAQKIDKIITRAETERIETYLASNELAGRKPFTPGIEKPPNLSRKNSIKQVYKRRMAPICNRFRCINLNS
jgi:predicted restriction endonuclease